MKIKRKILNIVGIVISIIILLLIFKRIFRNYSQIRGSLEQANWWLVLLGIGFMLIGEVFVVLMWRSFMYHLYNQRISISKSLVLMFLPNVTRYIPGKIWFVFGISYLSSLWNINTTSALTVTLMTQIMILLTSVIFGVVTLGIAGFSRFNWYLYLLLIPILVFIFSPSWLHKLIDFGLNIVRKEKHISHIPKISLNAVVTGVIYGLLLWFFIGIGMVISSKGIYNSISFKDFPAIAGAFSTSYFLGYVSFITPAGLGVREGAFIILLPPHIPSAHKGVLSIASRLWLTIMEIIIFLIAGIILKLESKTSSPPTPPVPHDGGTK